jgi:hypothetical protein
MNYCGDIKEQRHIERERDGDSYQDWKNRRGRRRKWSFKIFDCLRLMCLLTWKEGNPASLSLERERERRRKCACSRLCLFDSD